MEFRLNSHMKHKKSHSDKSYFLTYILQILPLYIVLIIAGRPFLELNANDNNK